MGAYEQRGITTNRDGQNGLTVVSKWVVDTLEETQTVGAGTLLGLPEESRTSHQLEGGPGRHNVLITYKGVQIETPAGQEKWSGKIKYREDPIETFPFLDELMKMYEGTIEDGKVVWPQFLSETNKAGGFGLSAGGKKAQRVNPMFGFKTWPVLMGQISRSYVRKSFPSNILEDPGKVLERLPGNPGITTPDGYVWLVQPPEFDGLGREGWTLQENYDLIPRDRALAVVYQLIKRK